MHIFRWLLGANIGYDRDFMAMKPALLVILLVLLRTPSALSSGAANPGNPPSTDAAFSADDFDWRTMVPFLLQASGQSAEQGIHTILENSSILRQYIRSGVRAECRPGNNRCDSSAAGFTLEDEVTRRIAGIVKEELRHERKSVVVDYRFDNRLFPFTEIAALRSDSQQDAYLLLKFAEHSYYVSSLRAKYGEPYDTDVFERFSIFKYRLKNSAYASKAVFEVDPSDGAVMKVAISLKAKKRH